MSGAMGDEGMGDDHFADPPNPLLAPIPGADPAGADLRYDPVYDRIQDARREEDSSSPQGIWSAKLKRADWVLVRDEVETVLAERSKDLQLAVWLLEAWLQLRGLSGFARGLRLIDSLCQQFWPVLYPKLDPDDPEARLAPLYWLDSKMSARIGQLPLTAPDGTDDPPFSWQDLAGAQKLEPLAKSSPVNYAEAVERGAITLAKFNAAVRATSTAFYQDLQDDLQSSADGLQGLRATLDSLCGPDSPVMGGIERSLEFLSLFVRVTLAERGVGTAEPTPPRPTAAETALPATQPSKPPRPDRPAAETGPLPAMPSHSAPAMPAGPIASREQAYRMLADAADYLALTEPHSPTPYLVRRAVGWGRMTLADLLAELIDDDGGRRPIQKLLQIPEN